MIILVDTSVWIEFFKKSTHLDVASLELFIEQRQVATCLPIKAEILSGEMSGSTRSQIKLGMEALHSADRDWGSPETWDLLIELALIARKNKVPIPGLVDRMILLCAKTSQCILWTLDRKLKKLASLNQVPLFPLD